MTLNGRRDKSKVMIMMMKVVVAVMAKSAMRKNVGLGANAL